MTLFQQISFITCLSCTLLIAFIFFHLKHCITKPSFIALLSFHIQVQWGATINAHVIEETLLEPWNFFVMVQLFPLVALFITPWSWNREAKELFSRLNPKLLVGNYSYNFFIFISGFYIFYILYWYFSVVPIHKTGFYVMLTSPKVSQIAREESLKLLTSVPLKYAYSTFSNFISQFVSIILFIHIIRSLKNKKITHCLFYISFLVLIMFLASIYGARAPASFILLAIFTAVFLSLHKKISKFYLPIFFLILLFIPTLFSIFREGRELTVENFITIFKYILIRTFWGTTKTVLWHMQFVEEFGTLGIAGIGNLSRIFGIEPINLFNLIGITYTHTLKSISANTPFNVAYYACFGNLAFFISLPLLFLLDGILVIINKLSDKYLLATLATVLVATSQLASTLYTTIFITYGFLLVPVFIFCLEIIFSTPKKCQKVDFSPH